MKRITVAISLTMASLVSMAQINVFSGNNVGIGAGLTSSASVLSINTTGYNYASVSLAPTSTTIGRGLLTTNIATSSANYIGLGTSLSSTSGGYGAVLRGVWGYSCNTTAQGQGQAYGVIGTAGNCTSGYNYGVWGNLTGTNGGAAVYGTVNGGQPNVGSDLYAGYFIGKVNITGSLWVNGTQITSSDQKLKKNIASLDSSDRIYNLLPKKYFLKTQNELVASSVKKSMTSDTGKF